MLDAKDVTVDGYSDARKTNRKAVQDAWRDVTLVLGRQPVNMEPLIDASELNEMNGGCNVLILLTAVGRMHFPACHGYRQ